MSKETDQKDLPRNPMQVQPVNPAMLTEAQRQAEKAIALAKQAQEVRRVAPLATGGQSDCKATQTIDRIASKHGGQLAKDGYFWYMDDHRSITDNALKGGVPHIEEGEFVRNETDILFKAPTWLYHKNRKDETSASDAMIQDVIDEDSKKKANMRPDEQRLNRTVIAKKGTPEYEQALAGGDGS